MDIARLRLHNQCIAGSRFTDPADAVNWLGAMQAQDYPGALWSVGLRTPGATVKDVEAAVANRTIVRSWPMRGTLHFVAAADLRWMLKLLAGRVLAGRAARQRNLELDDATFNRARELIIAALSGGKILSRADLCAVLDAGGIATAGQRGYHILSHLSLEGVLCFGPHAGKQPTFTLLEDWLPTAPELSRDESLAELTRRYFTSHGPATAKDFAWWSGLTMSDVKAGLSMAAPHLMSETVGAITYWLSRDLTNPPRQNDTYLLPGFDEYLLGYTDRSAVLPAAHSQKIVPGNNGMFLPTIISDGRVIGIWKRVIKKSGIVLTPIPFAPLTASQTAAFEAAAGPYRRFIQE